MLIGFYKNIGQKSDRPCKRCGSEENVTWVSSMTMYHFEGVLGSEEDPNKPISLCKSCEEEHVEYWKDLWDSYYAGLI